MVYKMAVFHETADIKANTKDATRGKRCRLRCVTTVLMGTSVVFMIIVCALLIHWNNIRTLHHQPPRQSVPKLCVPLDDIPGELRNNIEETPNIKVHHSDNETTFCGDADLVLKWVSELSFEVLYDSDSLPEYKFYHELVPKTCKATSETETVYKLTDLDMENSEHRTNNTIADVPKIFWKRGRGYSSGDIKCEVEDGAIIIQHAGLYHVSTQITMEVNDAFTQLTHFLYKNDTNGNVEKLMENRKFRCDPVTKESTNLTSSIGAVFDFKKYDRVYVATYSPELLVPGSSSNTFIVYAL